MCNGENSYDNNIKYAMRMAGGGAYDIRDKIINLRKKNGWSQEELAHKLGVSRQSISKYEGAQAVPDLDKILKLSQIFGVTTDYLIKDEMEEEIYTGRILMKKTNHSIK